MGMRGTIAFVDTDRSVRLTTVQWSTHLDRTIGHFAAMARKDEQDMYTEVAELFRAITRYNHISCLEVENDKFAAEKNDEKVGYGVYINRPVNDAPVKISKNRNFIDIYNYHLDSDSMGAIYDMAKPDKIEFFWENNYGVIEKRICGIMSLANFYNDIEATPNKLKKFGFLRG